MNNLPSDSDRKQGKSAGPRPVEPSDTPPWTDRLLKDSEERPAACLFNAFLALSESPVWASRLAFDETSQQVILRSSPFWSDVESWRPRPWTDDDDSRATCWLQSQCRIMVGSTLTAQAVESVARLSPFHPIRDYLSGLKWDGIPRIHTWLSDYMAVEYSEISSAFGSRFLISCAARAFHPGCKVDTCLFLEGDQGKLKSTALSVLAGEWFTDELPDIRDKDAAIQLCGKWIIEIGEMGAFKDVPVYRVKQFLSRSVDRYRPPYGRRAIDVPRGCVFVGTVNSDAYLKDESGARRFWPVTTHDEMDVVSLARVRDQLWAEAVHCYRSHFPWWLDTDDLNILAAHEQSARYVTDDWMDEISRYITGRPDTSLAEVAECCLHISLLAFDQPLQNRVAKILRFLGWVRYQPVLSDGSRPRRYRHKTALDAGK